MNPAHNGIYRFENVEIDPSQVSLRCNGREQYLRQQAFQVLLYLIEQRHRLVGKEELIEKIWRSVAVTDNTVDQCIFDIRKTLGDDWRQPRFIKTIPKAGYRWIVPVEQCLAPPPESAYSRPFVVLLSLTDLSGRSEEAWLSTALCAWLSSELSMGKQIQVASAASVARMKAEIGLSGLDDLGREDLVKIRENFGADVVIMGSYARSGGNIRLTVRMEDTREGGTIDAIAETAPESHLFDLVSRVKERLCAKLPGTNPYRVHSGATQV